MLDHSRFTQYKNQLEMQKKELKEVGAKALVRLSKDDSQGIKMYS